MAAGSEVAGRATPRAAWLAEPRIVWRISEARNAPGEDRRTLQANDRAVGPEHDNEEAEGGGAERAARRREMRLRRGAAGPPLEEIWI